MYGGSVGVEATGSITGEVRDKNETQETVSHTAVFVAEINVPPFTNVSAVAIASRAKITLRWHSEATKVHLSTGHVVIAPYSGTFTIQDAQSFTVRYRCWAIKNRKKVKCPSKVSTVHVVSGRDDLDDSDVAAFEEANSDDSDSSEDDD